MTSHVLTSPDKLITIEWDCSYRNPVSDSSYLRIAQATEEPDTGVRIAFSFLMANTRNITFTYKGGAPSEPIAQLEQFWEWAKEKLYIREGGVNISVVEDKPILQAAYPLFNRLVCNELQEEWATAYQKAQVLFPSKPEYKPDNQLTEDLLKNPDFLSAVAKLLGNSGLGAGK